MNKKNIFLSILLVMVLFFQIFAPHLAILLNNANFNLQAARNQKIEKKAVQWTYIGYFCADNNLDEYGIDDINEMEKGMIDTADVEVIALIDRYYSGAKTYRIRHDSLSSINSPVQTTGLPNEPNMGDGQTLEDFLIWVFNHPDYSADKYILDLWDHGAGWPGICYDDSSGQDGLTLQEVQDAISDALIATGEDKIDIISMDACLMGMLEVSYYLHDLCDIFVASEEVIYAPGYPYEDIIGHMCSNPSDDAYQMASATVDYYENEYSSYEGCTLSAVSLNSTSYSDLTTTFEKFASSMYDYLLGQLNEIESARLQSQEFYYPYYIDLYDLCDYLSTSGLSYISPNASAMMNAINDAVIKYCATGSSRAKGISIYFPKEDTDYRSSYSSQKLALETDWDEFLGYYYSAPSVSVDISSYSTNGTVLNASTVELTVTLKNTGTIDAEDVNGSLHSNDVNVTVSPSDKFHNYGSISPDDEESGIFIFNVSSDLENDTMITLYFNLSAKFTGIANNVRKNISLFFIIGRDALLGGSSFDSAVSVSFGSFLGLLPGPATDNSGWYKFNITSLTTITSVLFNLTSPVTAGDFDLYIYSPDEVLITVANSADFPDLTSFTPDQTGSYRIKVHPFSGEGIFFLKIEQNLDCEDGNSMGTAFEIIPGVDTTFSGDLPNTDHSNGYEFYRIVLKAGEGITIKVSGDSGTDFDVYLVDVQFNVLDYSDSVYYPERINFKAEDSSVYYIILLSYSGSGDYSMDITVGAGFDNNMLMNIVLIVVIVVIVLIGLIIYFKFFT
ncbi:MAG: hypothetical protein GF329_06445 [Candidatus Lokiarchaeota archaeon]|nr:hypothetical protein [Candidatus Lokiarchaeota archaeon]